jgi:hypothetical protein
MDMTGEPAPASDGADPVDHNPGEQAPGQATEEPTPAQVESKPPPPEDLGDGGDAWVPV